MIGQRRGNAAWDGDRLVGLVRLLDDSEYIEIVPEKSKKRCLLPENYRFPAIFAMVSAAFS